MKYKHSQISRSKVTDKIIPSHREKKLEKIKGQKFKKQTKTKINNAFFL